MSDSIPFDVPNLDDMTTDPEELARAAKVLWELAQYAQDKSNAMIARSNGRTQAALALEQQCRRRYNALPGWARW